MGSKLSSLLVKEGLVPVKTLEEAFALQAILGGQLDTILLEKRLVTEEDLLSVTCRATGIAAALPHHFEHLSDSVAEFVPLDAARKLLACPVAIDSKNLTLLVTESTDSFALEDLAYELERKIHPFVTSELRILQAQREVYGTTLEPRYSRLLERLGDEHPSVDVTPDEAAVIEPTPRRQEAEPVTILEPLHSDSEMEAEAPDAVEMETETPDAVEMDAEAPDAVEMEAEAPDAEAPDAVEMDAGMPPSEPVPVDDRPPDAAGATEGADRRVGLDESLPKVMVDPELTTETPPPQAAPEVMAEMPPIPTGEEERSLSDLPEQELLLEAVADAWDEPTDPGGPSGLASDDIDTEVIDVSAMPPPDDFSEDTEPGLRPAVRVETEQESPHLDAETKDEISDTVLDFDAAESTGDEPVDEEPTPADAVPAALFHDDDDDDDDDDETADEEPTPSDRPTVVVVAKPPDESVEEDPTPADPAPVAIGAEATVADSVITEGDEEASIVPPAPQDVELEEALAKIRASNTRDELLLAIAQAVQHYDVDGVKIYVVKGTLLAGHMELGHTSTAREEIKEQPPLSLEIPTVLARAVQTGTIYLGPTPDTDASASVLAAAGILHPRSLILLPVVLRKKVICLIMGYSMGRTMPSAIRGSLARLAREAAVALAELIVRLKEGKKPAQQGEARQEEAPTPDVYTGDESGAERRVISDIDVTAGPQEEEQPASTPAIAAPADLITLLRQLEEGGTVAEMAEGLIQDMSKDAVPSLVSWFPGRLLFNRLTSPGEIPPVSECSAVLHALVAIGRPVLSAIAPLLLHADTEIRFYATYLTSELVYPEAVALLARQLSDPDRDIRRVAVKVLRQFRQLPQFPEVLADLRNDLNNPDPRPRRGAIEALGALGDQGAVPALVELVLDEDPVAAHTAQVALVNITKQDFSGNTEAWRSWWERNQHRKRVEWVIDGLVHEDVAIRVGSITELDELTGKTFGYSYDMARRDREAIRRRFLELLTLHEQDQT